ncbi:hypothetical protein CBS14141_004257 [Malassezia furfur]|nr:hypothetical protein CBS14141_004257 [Malassezia furfur]
MSDAGGSKVPSYHAPPSDSPISGATIHELRCLDARIQLGYHLIPHIVQTLLTELPSSAYVLVTDTHLERLGVVQKFEEAFVKYSPPGAPARVLVYIIPPGEESKSRETKAAMEDWMLEHRLTRDTIVMACGGGVIGDLVGFFMRGLKFVQIPTTLLAMVDSAVGGKTAIDHPHGKNLIGAFHQPQFVFVDAAFLLTLPPREFSNGMAEVVKTAAIWDAADFVKLETESEAIRSAVLGDEARSAPEQTGHTLATRTVSQSLLLDVIRGSIGVKAHIVNIDEKETGLRNLVNFGHSVGHAIEAVLTPEILHGECVSIGMILEAEIARVEHGLPQVAIGRLVRCLQAYDLPVSLSDARIAALSKAQELTTARLLDIMRVDKKNAGSAKKIVLLSRIGATVEERASTVSDAVIARVLAPAATVRPVLPVPVATHTTLVTPGSKSISNRALLLAALAGGTCRLRNVLYSDDTQVMMNALRTLRSADFTFEDGGQTLVVHGHGGRVEAPAADEAIYLQNAGTAARFMTAVACLQRDAARAIELTGNKRMQQRPIGALVDALRANGSEVAYRGAEAAACRCIGGGGLRGGRMTLAADVSSQYVSAILLCAPYATEPVTLELVGGKVISQPYIDMTLAMMASFGVQVERERGADGALRDVYCVPRATYQAPAHYEVESDASSATYPLALAAITGTQCTVPTIGSSSLQGDARFATDVLRPMGCTVEQTATSTTVTGPPPGTLRQLGTVDMEPMTDAFITAAVLFAVAQGGATRITGIANQRVKETNRIRAVIDELAKFGVATREWDDGIEVSGVALSALRSAEVHCYDDHRIAMAFSVLGAVAPLPGTTLLEKRCVEKTWPGWWDDLQLRLGVVVSGAHLDAPLVPVPSYAPAAQAAALSPLCPSLTPQRYAPEATVVCIGMRASGKTHIGRLLAARLGHVFVDADEVFAQRHGSLNARASHFVSLTFPDVRAALPTLDEWTAGADVIEVRVDLLDPAGTPTLAHVREQVSLLRNATPLPLLYTVRSVSQGGRFPEAEEDLYFALVRLGLRLGCEYIDVELHRSAARLAAVRAQRGHAVIIASSHDTTGAVPWTSTRMRALYAQGTRVGDYVKLVGTARTMADNLHLEAFRAAQTRVPLIALNMGAEGQLSRVLNTVLTPVTHPALPAKAAPGQLSIAEIHAARHLLGLLPARRFALLGTPIAHSLSPLLHNTGFALLGLPYTYALHECDTLDGIDTALLRAPDFGGASVTIPHKLRIMQYLDEIAPEAQIIGAVNTVIPVEVEGRRVLRGDNTDWQAIHALAAARITLPPHSTVLVVGAGGSARAALYAMHTLGAAEILLCNRTYEKAEALADAVPKEWRVRAVRTLADAAAQRPAVVVGNVPADGQSLDGTTALSFEEALFAHPGGVAIDMAYKPADTPLLQCAAACGWHAVPGIAILLEQGFRQFALWTHAPPPRRPIERTVLAAYAS